MNLTEPTCTQQMAMNWELCFDVLLLFKYCFVRFESLFYPRERNSKRYLQLEDICAKTRKGERRIKGLCYLFYIWYPKIHSNPFVQTPLQLTNSDISTIVGGPSLNGKDNVTMLHLIDNVFIISHVRLIESHPRLTKVMNPKYYIVTVSSSFTMTLLFNHEALCTFIKAWHKYAKQDVKVSIWYEKLLVSLFVQWSVLLLRYCSNSKRITKQCWRSNFWFDILRKTIRYMYMLTTTYEISIHNFHQNSSSNIWIWFWGLIKKNIY